MLADETASEGDWLVALAQDAGRGRQGREWVGGKGNYFGSTLVNLKREDPPGPSLSLAAGLALIEAVDAAVPEQPLMLKWPNDLLLGGRKMAGILLERSDDRIVAGFGVNLAQAPDLPDRKSAALGGRITAQAFAPLLAASFARLLGLWRSNDAKRLSDAWLVRAHPLGSPLTVHLSSEESRSGRFDGIEVDGALRLRTETGIEIVRAGDVSL